MNDSMFSISIRASWRFRIAVRTRLVARHIKYNTGNDLYAGKLRDFSIVGTNSASSWLPPSMRYDG